MIKPFPFLAILVSLVLIVLSNPIPLKNSSYGFLTSTEESKSVEAQLSRGTSSFNNLMKGLGVSPYVAHRGAPDASRKPENSLSCFKASKKLGYKLVETDLQLTKDGQWVIIHDYTLDRTTNGKGVVRSHSLNSIKKLRLKDSVEEDLSVPTLDEFLSLCKDEELIPILDIKPDEKTIVPKDYDSILMSLSKYDLLDKSIFTSPSREVLRELRKRDTLTVIAVMADVSQDNLDFVKKLDNAFIYSNHKNLTDEHIELVHKNNLRFGTWTINDEKVAKHFLDKGAIIIVTDSLLKEI